MTVVIRASPRPVAEDVFMVIAKMQRSTTWLESFTAGDNRHGPWPPIWTRVAGGWHARTSDPLWRQPSAE
ncbi:uncharacterized protein POS17_2946 [Pseudomonas sp. Os17]|nr:uncharacterized protein POS17_2946 [Pseudomonas sp. Os17]